MSSMQPTTELKPTVQWWGGWQVDLSKYLVSQKVLISWRSFGRSKTIYIYRLPWEQAIPVPIPHNFLNITSQLEATKSASRQQTTTQIPPKHRLNLKKMTNRAEMIFTKFQMRCDAKQPKDCKPNNHFKPLFPTFHWWPNLAAFPSSRGSAVCELCEKTFATHRKEWREIIYIE